jgi:hypothetical protein
VSFYDALRFINWLENDQPDGPQDPTTTEDGAYTITPAAITANSIARRPDAHFVLPTEDEWYKAAYYDVASESYRTYPANDSFPTTCAAPGATPNTANCDGAVGDTSAVGSYAASASPNGTFDQGGNVWEWTESIAGADRRIRGGAFDSAPGDLASASSGAASDPLEESADLGFRVVPEPDATLSLLAGAVALSALVRRRARPQRGCWAFTPCSGVFRRERRRPHPSLAEIPR